MSGKVTASPPEPRIGLVLHLAARDGAGLAAVELARGLAAKGVRCLATVPGSGPIQNELWEAGADVAVVPYRWWMDRGSGTLKRAARTLWNVAATVWLAAVLRRREVGLVVSNSLAVAAGAGAARLLRLPHLWLVHELWGGETGFAFDLGERRSLRLIDRLSDSCLASSQFVRGRLAAGGVGEGKLGVVQQAVSVADRDVPPAARPEGSFVCVVVGTVFPLKRQEDAVRAVGRLARAGATCELWLVGREHAGYGERLREIANREGARVRFFGEVDQPTPLVRAADVALSCGTVEGFGRTVIEAMSLGVPVVAADAGASAELIEDGSTGLLYKAGDPDDLARCLTLLLHDGELRRRLADAGRRWTEGRFTREAYAANVLEAAARATGREF